jgi:acyl-[acyl carrier protein]--UDP-N-acetylglucosamine O-acyltransferase
MRLESALEELTSLSAQFPEVEHFTTFIRQSERGIIR